MALPPETEKARLEFARRQARLKEDHPELFADRCTESAHGDHSPLDKQGRCSWCERKVGPALPMPRLPTASGDHAQAYREHWDPDWDYQY